VLTASAVSVGVQDARQRAQTGALGRLAAGWQFRVLANYDATGICWYPAQFYARAMERIRFYPAILNDAGEPEEVEDGDIKDLFDRIHDPGSTNMRRLAKSYGQLSFLIGDGYLIASEEDNDEVWEYLSPAELRVTPNTEPQEYRRLRAPGATQEELAEADDSDFTPLTGDNARVYRLWRKHPTYSQWSDSPMRPVVTSFDTLSSLMMAVGAEALSRAAQRGLLFIPDELTIESTEAGVDDDPEADQLIRELIEGMTTAIQNPGSVDSMSPFVLRGPGILEGQSSTRPIATADAIKWIPMGPQDRYTEIEAAEKVIEWIALSLDMPKEMLTGTGSVNHWGGWLLDEQGFRQHVAPVVEEFCDDIAGAYLRPAAVDAGAPNADRVVVWYDPVEAIAHPDEGPAAKDAWDSGAVGREFYRRAIGATDDDAPTPEDETFLLELKGRSAAATPPTGETPPNEGGTGADANEGAPETNPADEAGGNGSDNAVASAALSAAMIVGAAEMQVKAARKLAGSRLVQRSKSCTDCQDTIRDVEHALVASAMGPVMVRNVINGHTSEAALVEGAGRLLAAQARDWGVRGEWPDELGEMVEAHALRTLYEAKAPPLPKGFADVVAKALR
jgi:hypothetical protein